MLQVLGWVIYALVCLWAIGALIHIRWVTFTGEGAAAGYVNGVAACIVSAGVLAALGASPFHIVWLTPVCLVVGGLSQVGLPFAVLTPLLGKPLVSIVCVGMDRELIARRRNQWQQAQQMAVEKGISFDEAARMIAERGDWQ